jgi:2-polyprenyl-6-methoxyphenol hydroxylase-like FAD-dependent oxidoreductase
VNQPDRQLIIGAGPVGLGAALFLIRQGLVPRVVEMQGKPSQLSKALAVNPRTLDILESTGLSRQMLDLGVPIYGVRFYRRGRTIGTLSFTNIHPKYPFMLALSQATTERLLARALEAAGGRVERRVKMVHCRLLVDRVEVTLEPGDGGPQEVVQCQWLLAADGAHSVTRLQMGVNFVGSSFPKNWHLADAPLRTSLAADYAHVFFLEGGAFLFLIRVVDEALKSQAGEAIWRVLGNCPEPLSQLVQAEQAGPPIWTSSFHISHRMNTTLGVGGVYFAGDSAHIHSPVGARGMNLGLEDAWLFSELVRANRLSEYDRLRRSVDLQVVRRVEFLSRIASAESAFYRFVQAFVFPIAIKVPFVHTRMVATVTGLDHELPQVTSAGTMKEASE